MQMIFSLKLKNCKWIQILFSDFSLTFSEKSLISLTFPGPLTNSLTFPNFPDRVETLQLANTEEVLENSAVLDNSSGLHAYIWTGKAERTTEISSHHLYVVNFAPPYSTEPS